MNLDQAFDEDLLAWHRSKGGAPLNPAGHAIRLLREVVELCVASGATEGQIKMAVRRECDKAEKRKEFGKNVGLVGRAEEFADVTILMKIYEGYFLSPRIVSTETVRKFQVCQAKEWQPDSDGVLWRPGTVAVSGSALEPDRS